MIENNEGKNKSNDENSIYQSFSKNNIFTSNNENTLRTNNKEQLMDFSFKKRSEIINDLTSTIKNSKFNLLNIYSKDDKNIVKSGHFAKIRQTKHKKKVKEFIKPDTNYLIKTLFVDSSNSKNNSTKNNKIPNINNNNKENENNNFYHTVGGGEDNLFEKVKTKYILPNKKDKNLNLNKTKPLFNKKILTEIHNFKNSSKNKKTRNINNYINNAESKKNAFDSCKENNKENIKYKKINHEIKSNKNQNSKKIIKFKKNKIFFSSHTNSIFSTKNMNLSNLYNNYNSNALKRESSSNKNIQNTKNKNKSNNTSFLNKTLDINFNEKKISDSLYKKLDTINKRLILFSEYNKKLTKQIKDLNEEISSFENSKSNSKKIIQSDRRNISYKLMPNSPNHNKNNSSKFNSDIKNILLKRKIKNVKINYMKNKNKTCLNQSLKEHHCYADSLNIISEFKIKSNKKNTNTKNSKNKNNSNFRNENSSKNKNENSKNKENKDIIKGRNKLDRKEFKKRRINSNNISEYIHIKKVLPI